MVIEDMRNLDVARANLFQPLVIAEDDENSHVLIAQLLVGGEKLITLPQSWYTVSLHFRRADGTVGTVAGTCTEDGRIRVPIPDRLLELDDMVQCDICLNQRKTVIRHTLAVADGELIADAHVKTADLPLRTGRFKIDAQYRVII